MFTKAFLIATLERAIKTFAQTAAMLLIGSATGMPMIGQLDWAGVASASAVAAVLSVLTSIGSSAFTPGPGPSAVNAEVLSPPAPPPPGDT